MPPRSSWARPPPRAPPPPPLSRPPSAPVVGVPAYPAAILVDPAAALRPRGLFDLLSPSGAALLALGMTGAYPWQLGHWWTLLTAAYLHGSLLHIAFNLLWIHQLAPAVEQAYGRSPPLLTLTGGRVPRLL